MLATACIELMMCMYRHAVVSVTWGEFRNTCIDIVCAWHDLYKPVVCLIWLVLTRAGLGTACVDPGCAFYSPEV